MVQFVLAHTGVKSHLAERFKRVLRLARDGTKLATELVQTRCERGAKIATQLGFGQRVADGIFSLDEHWNGRGKPLGLQDNNIPLFSRIALLAQVVDVFHHVGGPTTALLEIQARTGGWFDPQLVDCASSFEHDAAFWATLRNVDIGTLAQEIEPDSNTLTIDDDLMDNIAAAFSQVVDAKSPFTAGHSERVALYTDILASKLGLDDARRAAT